MLPVLMALITYSELVSLTPGLCLHTKMHDQTWVAELRLFSPLHLCPQSKELHDLLCHSLEHNQGLVKIEDLHAHLLTTDKGTLQGLLIATAPTAPHS